MTAEIRIETLTPTGWRDYELLDSGNGLKLERFGPYHLMRPEVQALWQPALPQDQWRGADASFLWLIEEVGELATALRSGTQQEREEEFADVLAWLATLANMTAVDLEAAVEKKYGQGCPSCRSVPCGCDPAEKP